MIAAAISTASVTVASAGSSRRIRRAQKCHSLICPVWAISRTTRREIKNPETTKKMSTPRNPEGKPFGEKCHNMTATTAIARNPSSPPT